MTVTQLIEALQRMPPHYFVLVGADGDEREIVEVERGPDGTVIVEAE